MRIALDLGEWAEGRRIHVFLGRESYAVYEPHEGWFVKTERCNFCGKCCEVNENHYLGTKEIDGKLYCGMIRYDEIEDRFYCNAGPRAPFSCSSDTPGILPHPDCVIRYEKLA